MESGNSAIIEVSDLVFSYRQDGAPVLKHINLRVQKGEFVGITGPTGVGKTTLSYCINGVIPHSIEGFYCGDVKIKGRSTFEMPTQELSRWVGSVFQDPEAQLVSANVEEELAFGPENLAVPPADIEERIEFALNAVGIGRLRNASISSLSGGQKQRVAIAAVLTMLPEIIILDEPTSELDPVGTDNVFEVLRKLNQELGITIIVIEHKLEHLAEYCSRLIIMEDGQIRIDGAPARIFADWLEIKKLGVNPPQVTEFVGRLTGADRGALPVTLENAKAVMQDFLNGGKEMDRNE